MINVTKRSGKTEPLDLNKFHTVVENACDGLTGVSVSELEMTSQVQFFDGIKTTDIQETLIKAASELITEDAPNYQYVAGRLINYHLRKEVYDSFTPPTLFEHYKKYQELGYYDPNIQDLYSLDEWLELGNYIDHSRDDLFTYAAMEQLRGKYLVKNRVTGEFCETPQMAFMLIGMTLFGSYEKDKLKWVKEFYDSLSTFEISMPTPIMAGVRTPQRQFSSCVLIDCGDSLDSIIATTGSIVKYVSQRAGIGINAGKLRAIGSKVRNGDTSTTGVIPYYKLFERAVKSASQGGIRGGSATLHYPIWHLEVEDLLVLKNNKGTEDNRVRHLDYSVQFNKLMYERLIAGGNITLFSPNDVPGLYESFFNDQAKFKTLYEKYEADTSIRKKSLSALELFSAFIQERKDTGRLYLMNVDHCNTHSSYDENKTSLTMSNLCVSGDTMVTCQDASGDIFDVPIKDAIVGNKVYSRNIKTGKSEFRNITNHGMTGINRKVLKITDEDTGLFVICTPEHKIYTKNRGYVEAQFLLTTDILCLDN